MLIRSYLNSSCSKSFKITAAHLARLAEQCSYRLQGDKILFGIRSATVKNGYNQWQNELWLEETIPDFINLRCTMGIWNIKTQKLAAFPASTIPHQFWIEKQRDNPDKRISNMLSEGVYNYFVGAHEPNERAKEEGALRLSRLQPVGVWRLLSREAEFCDGKATFDVAVVDDHIHSAQSEGKLTGISYASAGCQVVEGDHFPPNPPTGYYQDFRLLSDQSFIPSPYEIGLQYHYLLTHVRHLFAIHDGLSEIRLLHGSHGYLVRKLQEALIDKNYLDEGLIDKGYFNGYTAKALYHFQQKQKGLIPSAVATVKDLNELGIDIIR